MDLGTRALLNSLGLLVLGSVLTFLATRYWHQKAYVEKTAENLASERRADAAKIAAEHKHLVDKVAELEQKLASINQAVQPISAAFQAILIKELTHFHTPELDELLTRVGPPLMLTSAEEERMALLLKQRAESIDAEIPELERDAALMLPLIIKRVRAEIASDEIPELQVVEMTTVTPAPANEEGKA